MARKSKLVLSVRKYGRKALQTGTHPQAWRQGTPFAKLGPTGDVGPYLLCRVYLDFFTLNLLQRNGIPISINKLENMFRQTVYKQLERRLDSKIDTWVPTKTGKLRKSLKTSLTMTGGSSVHKFPFEIILRTEDLIYASPVNLMPTSSLRKSGRAPSAVRQWMNRLTLDGRSYSKRLFKTYQKQIARLLPQKEISRIYVGRRISSWNVAQKLVRYSRS